MPVLDEDIDFLEHYGKKGMKWGTRKDHRNNRAESLARVGRGEGTKRDKIKTLAKVSALDVAKDGFKGAAAKKGKDQQDRNARVRSGEASVKDKLKYYGGTRIQDIGG